MKPLIIISIILILFSSFLYGQDENVFNLTILFTNDTNGHPLSFSYLGDDNQGGIPARATLIKKIQKENKGRDFIILDSGGVIKGRPESNLFDGETDIAGMNSIGYLASGVGIPELYNSVEEFQALNNKAKFYFLCANIESKSNPNEEICDKFIVEKIGGLNGIKVGIFSIITDEAYEEISEESKNEIIFKDPIETSIKMVELLKSEENDVDLVIALTYMGYYPDDSRIGSRTLALSVDGIDIIIDGRTGLMLDEMVTINNTHLFQAYHWGLFLGQIDLSISNKEINDIQYRIHPVNYKINGNYVSDEIEEDKITYNAIKSKMFNYNSIVNKKIAKLEGEPLSSENVRNSESPLGNLVCDAILDYTKADVTFQNSGGFGEGNIEPGELNRTSLDEIIKYDNSIFVLNMTGEEIIDVIKHSMNNIGKGSFLQVGGVTFNYNKSSKILSDVKVDGLLIENSSFYKVAINSWLARGGDGYMEFREISYKTDLNILLREVVYEYLQKVQTYNSGVFGRVVIEE